MQFVLCVEPPRDDIDGSAFALVARSREAGFYRVVSGCLHIAGLAEVFLRPWSSRFQKYLSFEFGHGPPEELPLVRNPAIP